MTCGTEWNLDFSRKIPPDFTERRSSGWIRYILTMVCPFSGLLIEFSIFDTKWQEFNWKFGQYLQRWLAAPFSPAGFIEWWEIRYCGLKKGDPARNSGSRQAPIGGFTGRAKHFVNSEILTTSETMTFCQQIEQEQKRQQQDNNQQQNQHKHLVSEVLTTSKQHLTQQYLLENDKRFSGGFWLTPRWRAGTKQVSPIGDNLCVSSNNGRRRSEELIS